MAGIERVQIIVPKSVRTQLKLYAAAHEITMGEAITALLRHVCPAPSVPCATPGSQGGPSLCERI